MGSNSDELIANSLVMEDTVLCQLQAPLLAEHAPLLLYVPFQVALCTLHTPQRGTRAPA